MSATRYLAGVHFVKKYPHAERLRKLRRMVERDLLDLLVDRATVTRRVTFKSMDKLERQKIAVAIGCKEQAVANALGKLSKPAHDGGVELLVRLGRGRYRLNPEFYFIGDETARDNAMEMVADLNRRQIAARDKRKANARPVAAKRVAEVVSLRAVS